MRVREPALVIGFHPHLVTVLRRADSNPTLRGVAMVPRLAGAADGGGDGRARFHHAVCPRKPQDGKG